MTSSQQQPHLPSHPPRAAGTAAAPAHPPAIDVGGRLVGPGRPTFVIAEVGVNHDGSVQKAVELVKIAAACGADAVKLQVFRAATLMHPTAAFAEYQKDRTGDAGPADMLRRYELSRDELRTVVRAALDAKLVPLATPFSPADVDAVAALRLPAVKIASPDLVNLPLLDEALKLNKPLLLSTGAASMDEVRDTARWLDARGASYALLHCVSSYPCNAADANLGWVAELARAFDVPIGYSDHTTHAMAGALAAAAGACVIEKHLTYDRSARGPDHAASADPQGFERYVKFVREADALRGSAGKRVLACEQDVRRVSRQSLVLRRGVAAGQAITAADLTVQRPGTGVPAAQWDRVVGRHAARDVPAGAMLELDMLAEPAERAA